MSTTPHGSRFNTALRAADTADEVALSAFVEERQRKQDEYFVGRQRLHWAAMREQEQRPIQMTVPDGSLLAGIVLVFTCAAVFFYDEYRPVQHY